MLIILTSSCPYDNPYFCRYNQFSQEISPIAGIITVNKKSRFDYLTSSDFGSVYSIKSHLSHNCLFGLFISLFTSHINILYAIFYRFRSVPNRSLLIYGRSSFYFFLPILLARLLRIPVIIDHTEWFSFSEFSSRIAFLQFVDDYLFRYVISRLAGTHISISFSLSLYLNRIGLRNIRVMLPNFNTKLLIQNDARISKSNFDFVYSGSLKPSDDPIILLEAIEAFANDPLFVDSTILLQLSSVPIDLKPLVSRINNLPQITIFGRMPGNERLTLLKSASCSLLTHSEIGGSRYNIPSRYNDYLYIPSVITSFRLIAEDYIRHSTYLGYESGSSSSLLAAMKKIYSTDFC